MREENIERMDFKELRKEVQLLRDELALFKRKYNDAIMNLDEDNFGKSLTFTQNNMKSQIKMNAQEISTKLSTEELDGRLLNYSTVTQTANAISTAVVNINNTTDEKLENYSTIEQTAEAITTTVTAEYVTTLIGDEYVSNAVFNSQIAQTSEQILLSVSAQYETKTDAENEYSDLRRSISSISLGADSITSRVESLESFNTSVFTQTADGFTLDGNTTTFTGVLYLTGNDGERKYSFFLDESQNNQKQVMLHSVTSEQIPLILGDGDNVYVGSFGTGQEVATRAWVTANAGSTGTARAVFG